MSKITAIQADKTRAVEKQRLAEVTFLDPTELEFDSNPVKPCRCSTIGLVGDINNEFVKITWIEYEDEQDSGYGIVIPRGCIIGVRNLR